MLPRSLILLPFPTLEKHGFRHNTFLTRKPKCFAIAWCQKRTVIWWMWRMVPQPFLKIVQIGSVCKLERIFNLSLYTVIFISLLILFKKLRGQISWDFWLGVPNILGFLTGGAKYPRILGRGVPNILGFLAGGAKYPRIFGGGCQISYSLMGVPVFLKGC